jgi:M6 family metalloprotease-like protein
MENFYSLTGYPQCKMRNDHFHLIKRNPFLHFLVTLSIILISVQAGFCVPSYPNPITIVQPDGSKITVLLRGDESMHWFESTDGYTLMKNDKGLLEYATVNQNKDLVPSGIAVKNIDARSSSDKTFLSKIQPYLTYSRSQVSMMKQIKKVYESGEKMVFPTTGTRKLVCILIGFTDLAFTKTQSDFNNLFNQVGYATDGAYGSVKDYYLQNSWNQLTLSVTIAGPYTASNTMAYYGGNDAFGNDKKPRALVTEAVNLANPDVNYADFDNDGDGSVDGIYVIYAGYGEEAGASSNAIWAHAWNISTVTLDGKTISKYSCSPELRNNSGTGITRIGVICHEFGHVLGAPDFYDTDYATGGGYLGTGQWDMMANGSWNLSGASPAHHNGYTKWKCYNWYTPTLLTASQKVSVTNIENNKNGYYYTTVTSGEYFFMENRQQTGFDAAIPGHGLVIYHVNGNGISSTQSSNDINATYPQYMYPVCASALTNPGSMPSTYGMINTGGCPFPGSSEVTEFTDGSLPGSLDQAGNRTNKPVTEISESSGVITFSFMDASLPGNLVATSASTTEIDLSWTLNSNSNPVLIAFSTTNDFGNPADGTTYSNGDTLSGGGKVIYYGTSTSYNHTPVKASTTYYYKAWSNVSGVYSKPISASASSGCGVISTFPYNESFLSTSQPNCWTQYDSIGKNQIWQFGTLSGYTPNPALSGYYAYLNSDAYGNGNTENADLISPVFDFSKCTNIVFGFNYYFRFYSPSTASLFYSKDNGVSWSKLQTWTTSSANPAAYSLDMTSQLAGYSNVLFKWNYTGTYGYYWAIDDISITADNLVDRITTVSNVSVGNNESECYNATDTIYVAGKGTTVDFQSGSTVDLIAGKSISFLPGFHAYEGSYVYGWITETSDFCSSLSSSIIENQTIEKSVAISDQIQQAKIILDEKSVKVYPNPSTGRFTLELTHYEGASEVSIFNAMGALIKRIIITNDKTEFEFSTISKGLYFITIKNEGNITSRKIVIE